VVMACLAAGFGLLPASIATEIGSQTQKPLARVVVGGMVTTLLAILFVIPLMARERSKNGEDNDSEVGASEVGAD
jgi:heavy metal efflux system protein